MKKWKRFLIVSLCAIFLSTAIISSYGQGSVVKASESGSNERIITAVASWEILAALLSLFAATGIAVNVSNFFDADVPPIYNPDSGQVEVGDATGIDNVNDALTGLLGEIGVDMSEEEMEELFNGYKPGDDEDGDGHPDSPGDPSDPNSWLEWVKSMVKLGKQHKVGVVTSALLGYMLYDSYNDCKEFSDSDSVPAEITSLRDSIPGTSFYSGLWFNESVFGDNSLVKGKEDFYFNDNYVLATIHCNLSDGRKVMSLLTTSNYNKKVPIDKCYISSFDPLTFSRYQFFNLYEGGDWHSKVPAYSVVDYNTIYGFYDNWSVSDFSNFRVFINPNVPLKISDGSNVDINNVIRVQFENLSDSIKNVMSQMNSLSQAVSNVSNSINIPTGQQFSDYIKDLFNVKNPSEVQSITNNFINHVTTPVANPSPDNPSPDEPSVEEPLPDEPAPDKPDSSVNDGSNGLPNLVVKGLKTKFPFCIPFDLIMAFKLFEAPAEAPVWKLPLEVSTLGIYYELVIDFNEFEQLAVVLRWIELVAFILSLILITRSKLIKG